MSIYSEIKRILQSKFLKDSSVLALGTGATQLVSVVTVPIMTRLYDPAAYGFLALFIAVTGLISFSATLQYQDAVLLPKNDAESLALIKGGIVLGLLTMVFIMLGYLLPLERWLEGSNFSGIVDWVPLIAISIIPGGMASFFIAWLNRKQKFKAISISRFLIVIISTLTSLALGVYVGEGWGLVVGSFVGSISGFIMLSILFYKEGGSEILLVSWKLTRVQMKRYYRFPLYSSASNLFNQVTRQMPILVITGFVGAASTGMFNMSNRLLGLPNALFAQSLTEVFIQRAAKQYATTGECSGLYIKMLLGMTAVALPITIIMVLIAPALFAFVLGEKWRVAGEYSQILCWLFMFRLICSPLSAIFIISERQAEDLFIQIIGGVTLISSLFLSFYAFGDVESIILAYTLIYSGMYIYYGVRGYYLSQGKNNLKYQEVKFVDMSE